MSPATMKKERTTLSAADWETEALKMIADQGIRALAVEPLARKMGITKGSFYWHFPTREALLEQSVSDADHKRLAEDYLEQIGPAACRSYLVGCEQAKRVILVDPLAEDVDRVLVRMVDRRATDEDLVGGGFPRDFVARVRRMVRDAQYKRQPPILAKVGARTIAVTCNPDSPLAHAAEVPIVVAVGPEVIAGSTRMKGGLAQKMVMHLLSTTVMIRLGYVRGNLMTHMLPASAKLRDRAAAVAHVIFSMDLEPFN